MLVWNRPALLFISLRLATGAMGHGPEMFQTFNQQHNPLQKFEKIAKTYGALRQGLRWALIGPMGPMGQPLKKTNTHRRDGYVHAHGFRNDPCKGSRLPPLSSVMTQQRVSRVISSSQRYEDSAEGRQSSTPADLHLDTGQGTTGSAEIEVDDGGVDGEANMIGHPRQRRGMVMKHIPKGARFACSKALTDILQSIIGKPSEIEHWNRLL